MSENKITKVEQWFEDTIVQDQQEILDFGKFAALTLRNKFCIDIKPRSTIAIFVNTVEAFFEVLKEKQKNYRSYNITIEGYFSIGFSNSEDGDEEKVGNFCPYYISEQNIVLNEPEGAGESTDVLTAKWSAEHITADTDVISAVAAKSMQKLRDLKMVVSNSADTLIPIFCVIHAALVGFMRLRRTEMDVDNLIYSFGGVFDTICNMDADGNENVWFQPTLTKLAIKNDLNANDKGVEDEDE